MAMNYEVDMPLVNFMKQKCNVTDGNLMQTV